MAAAVAGAKKVSIVGNSLTINGSDGIKIATGGGVNNQDIMLSGNVYDGNPTDLEDFGLRTSSGGDPVDWKTYTPQVDQGVSTDISKTVTLARYSINGKKVTVEVRLDMTGAGSAGSAVLVSLPIAPSEDYYHCIGSGTYFDSGSATYNCNILTTDNGAQVQIVANSVTAQPASIGTNPNIAVANGDELDFLVNYETA